ncbi:MAG TPA: YfiR family protein [Thermoanaerobaculia bacterium]|nr:YfiR family protein [Thermoanaerobaculia bacterium]
MRRFLVLLLVLVATAAQAADVAVPASVQMGIFANIWRLDRNFKPAAEVTLGIVYQEEFRSSVATRDEVVAAILALHLPIRFVMINIREAAALAPHLTNIDVIYITPMRAIDVAAIAKLARTAHVRTITGVPEYVDAGLAVGIGVRKDRPLIIINLNASRAEGAAFSAQLLKLARIVE